MYIKIYDTHFFCYTCIFEFMYAMAYNFFDVALTVNTTSACFVCVYKLKTLGNIAKCAASDVTSGCAVHLVRICWESVPVCYL